MILEDDLQNESRVSGKVQVHTWGPLSGRGKNRKELRRERAEARTVDRDYRSATIQLRRLDIRLGKGLGAKKERAKLAKQL